MKALVLTLILGLAGWTAWAEGEDPVFQSQDQTDQQPGIAAQGSSGQQAATQSKADKEGAKTTLAPHTLMIQTQLQAAIEQVKGLKSQMNVAQGNPSPEAIEHFRMHNRELSSDFKSVLTHEAELQGKISQFPTLASSEEFRSANSAITEAHKAYQSWQSKAASNEYWRNQKQALTDLDQIQKRLDSALDKTKSLNSELNVRFVG